MDYKAFEKYMSDQLRTDEIPLDTDALIRQLHAHKKRRKGLWLWFLLPILGGTIAYGAFKGNDKPVNSKIKNESKSTHLITLPATEVKENLWNIADEDLPIETNGEASAKVSSAINTLQSTILTKKQYQKQSHPSTNTKKQHFLTDTNLPFAENTLPINQENTPISLIDKNNQIHHWPFFSPLPTIFHLIDNQNNISLNNDKIICPDFSIKSKLLIEIIPEVGVFKPIKSLENISTETGILPQRIEKEKSLEGLSAGIYGKVKHLKFPVYFKAGVTWSKLTERTRIDYAYNTRDTTKGIISITYSQTGDTITTIIGDIITERKLSGTKIRHYTLKMWDIPVILGYEKRWNEWFGGIETGVIINLTQRATGHMLFTDTSFINVESPVEIFKPRIGLSYTGGLYFGRDFKSWGRLHLSARMRWLPGEINVQPANNRQTYQFYGLYLGYSYIF
jgi:hypothetical protein